MLPDDKNKGLKEACIDFNTIARNYDRANTLISFGMASSWRRRLINSLALGQGLNLLDLATGTGDIAIMAAKKFPQVRISALDISEQMLAIANHKAARHKLTNINWLTGDMLALPFVDDSVDSITVAFGLRNVGDIDRAVSEIHRVLKPGGQLHILEFSMPERGLARLLFGVYFRWFMPVFGALATGKPQAYRYLYQSVRHFYTPAEFSQLLARHGLSNTPEPMAMSAVWLYNCQKDR